MTRARASVLLAAVAAMLAACGGDDGDQDAATDGDVDDGVADGDATADTDADADADGDADGGADIPNEWDFDIRLPGTHDLACTPGGTAASFPDKDWICSFSYDGVPAVIYARATPTACEDLYESAIPTYAVMGQVAAGGSTIPLSDTAYDYGGNHNNDFLLFSHSGRSFKAYHSSFGFGWHCCQPMDCLQLLDAGGAVLEDGCTCDRTIPAVCVQVQPDGTWAEMFDTFEVCAGDGICG